MSSRTAAGRSGAVSPREALRVVLVGGGLGLAVAGTLWLAVAGVWFAPGRRPPAVIAETLALSGSLPASVSAVVLGYVGLVVGVGAAALGVAARDPTGSGAIPDVGVPELVRRRLLLDVCLSTLAAAAAIAVAAILVPMVLGESEPLVAAFLLRLVLLAECGVVVVRLWGPLADQVALLEGLETRYDRYHDALEGLPDRHPVLSRRVRRAAVSGVVVIVVTAGVLAAGFASTAPASQPSLGGVFVALAGLGLPLCGVVGVLPTATTPRLDPEVRGQRTLVVAGSTLATVGVVAMGGLSMVLAGSAGLTVAWFSPVPVTHADALVGGWSLIFLGYAWRFRRASRTWLRDR